MNDIISLAEPYIPLCMLIAYRDNDKSANIDDPEELFTQPESHNGSVVLTIPLDRSSAPYEWACGRVDR